MAFSKNQIHFITASLHQACHTLIKAVHESYLCHCQEDKVVHESYLYYFQDGSKLTPDSRDVCEFKQSFQEGSFSKMSRSQGHFRDEEERLLCSKVDFRQPKIRSALRVYLK